MSNSIQEEDKNKKGRISRTRKHKISSNDIDEDVEGKEDVKLNPRRKQE